MAQSNRDKKSALRDVERADRIAKEYADNLRLSVQIARDRGATWEEIGELLGVSRQAAHERFSKAR